MKSVKNLVFSLLLVFAITASVTAGEVPIPPAPATTTPRATVTESADTTQPSSDPVQSGETVESDYFLFEALAALFLY